MKRILFSLFVVPFIMIPVIYAILIPLIDFMVPPKAPPSSFNLYGNNGMIAIWGGNTRLSFFLFSYCLLDTIQRYSKCRKKQPYYSKQTDEMDYAIGVTGCTNSRQSSECRFF